MIRSVTTRYALRSLRRNLRRTALSAVGVAFGVGVGLIAIAYIQGQMTMLFGAAAEGGIGHLKLAPAQWRETQRVELRLSDSEAQLEEIRQTPGVRVATPHASTRALLGLGTRSAQVSLLGVDPETEQASLRYVRQLDEGRYLEAGEDPGQIVIGRSVATRMRAEIDDELVVTGVDDEGQMRSALLVVVGIVDVGNREINDSIAHVPMGMIEQLSGRPGFTEITILIDDVHALEEMQERLAPSARGGDELLTWLEVSAQMRASQAEADGYGNAMLFIILLVVLMGVTSAQLTSVLERRREFAVLAAIGMRGRSLVMVLLTEGVVLGLLSGLGALLWAGPIVYHWSVDGVDMSALMGTDEAMQTGGVLFDMVFYPEFGASLIVTGLGLAMAATLLASIYPAVFASRTDPANALRVDQ